MLFLSQYVSTHLTGFTTNASVECVSVCFEMNETGNKLFELHRSPHLLVPTQTCRPTAIAIAIATATTITTTTRLTDNDDERISYCRCVCRIF